VKVLWTDSALAQLQAIHDYLAQTSPEYALRIIDPILVKQMLRTVRLPRLKVVRLPFGVENPTASGVVPSIFGIRKNSSPPIEIRKEVKEQI